MMNNKVGIIGAGFVGTAVEEGLQLIADIMVHDKFKNSYSLKTVVDECEILFLCLPTPMDKDGSCNISILEEVVDQINQIAIKRKSLVIKSTVTPGTTRGFSVAYPSHTFIFCPEFLTEKNFINDFLEQDRIFLGTVKDSNRADVGRVIRLFKKFTEIQKSPADIYEYDSKDVEMLKYVTNSFLATKVSFFNEIYEICKASDINYDMVINMLLKDKRVGKSHLMVPGHDGNRGYGGSCFPKDINGLRAFAESLEIDALMLEAAWSKNLMVREKYDWEKLAQVTGNYKKK